MSLVYNLLIVLLLVFVLYQIFISIEPNSAVYYGRVLNKTRLWKQVFREVFRR